MRLEKIDVAAAFLGVEIDTLYRWCNAGYAPCIRIGRGNSRRLLRFNMDRLRQWAEGQAQPGRKERVPEVEVPA
ncbi:MAG: hypothetical protein A3F84_08410 [Candidatus Handelsmanbacteria bacterium RIFCSPLOWO2_12_FULL_64_10]|uniref:Helix-turn-helix domain-containing protein n=1 Tax=Handelsmanbacteria sp. (strain RIFCSPLOWO2_12_FULL_64_10) TaxID=1817868 RepID=A0A1F6D5D9_HANXR|nr:MAG: hypothetical protein A3F84_08410 [Candidatus Handelsmanbacteria bacterium RIFCSPLOWO2_12_FULL_64_10]